MASHASQAAQILDFQHKVEVAYSCSQRCVPTQSSKAHLVPAQYWTFYPSVEQKKNKVILIFLQIIHIRLLSSTVPFWQ